MWKNTRRPAKVLLQRKGNTQRADCWLSITCCIASYYLDYSGFRISLRDCIRPQRTIQRRTIQRSKCVAGICHSKSAQSIEEKDQPVWCDSRLYVCVYAEETQPCLCVGFTQTLYVCDCWKGNQKDCVCVLKVEDCRVPAQKSPRRQPHN